MGLPQHWLQRRRVGPAWSGSAPRARAARRQHRHPHPRQRGPVGDPAGGPGRPGHARRPASATSATRACCCAGSTTAPQALLDLCFALLDEAKIMPYYFYMCDMIPGSEHWRLSLAEAQRAAARRSWATCPGSPPRGSSATCRTSASAGCTRSRGTTPSAASRTGPRTTAPAIEADDPLALSREYAYYDPIYTLPEPGQEWWRAQGEDEAAGLTAVPSASAAGTRTR